MSSIYDGLNPKLKDSSLSVGDFAKIEALLWLGKKVSLKSNAKDLYIILASYHLIGEDTFSNRDYLVAKARVSLGVFKSKKKWQEYLNKYMSKDFDNLRLYDIDEDFEYEEIKDENLFFRNREEDILALINWCHKPKIKEYIATEGNFSYRKYTGSNEKDTVYLEQEIYKVKENKKISPKEKSPIKVDLEKLINSAREMKEICPEDYCVDVLISNTFSKVLAGKIGKTNEIAIEDVTNMVGMVGAGKSTFVKALCYHLSKEDRRIVLVLDTVSEVFKTHGYFQKLKVNSTPFIGKSDRIKYIDQLNESGQIYLKDEYSKYLTSVCLIDGLSNGEETVEYGAEPCFALEKDGKRHQCGYYDICPTTLMERNTNTSNIIITTAQAFAQTRAGKELFLKKALYSFDLVIFDECDRVQKVLDELFSPYISFEDFIRSSSMEAQKYISTPLVESMSAENRGYHDYVSKLVRAKEMTMQVLDSLRFDLGGFNGFTNKQSFSAYTLIKAMQKDNICKISDDLSNMLINLSDVVLELSDRTRDLSYAFDLSNRNEDNDKCKERIVNWFKANGVTFCDKARKGCKSCSHKLEDKIICNDYKEKIILVLRLLSFEKYIKSLEDAYNNIASSDVEARDLFSFLHSRFREQQEFLPSSVMGNIFGFISEDNFDIKLFKQYAFGRSLMTELPFLLLDEAGKPQGPNVLLLSGSSFAPKSFGYHIHRDVNYIIEGDNRDKEFLEKSKFIDLAFDTRISGIKEERKSAELIKLCKEASAYIAHKIEKDNGKILVIVNSYEQAKIVCESLNASLLEYDYTNPCIELIKDSEKTKEGLKRGSVSNFNNINEKVLIAPAIAIERGHNIVDDIGHSAINSVFFFVRPMAIPDDLKIRNIKTNGYIAGYASDLDITDLYLRNKEIREKAVAFWRDLSNNKGISLNNLSDIYKSDIVSSLFVLLLQIFGRASRITDYEKEPPSIYFVDGAFRGSGENSFDFLKELRKYLDYIMEDDKYKEISQVLYGPFYKAFKKGIM